MSGASGIASQGFVGKPDGEFYGVIATPTSAVAVDTFGSWSQVKAATSKATQLSYIEVLGVAASMTFQLDVGVGGAGSEVVVASVTGFVAANGSAVFPLPGPVNITSGARVAVRIKTIAGGSQNPTVHLGAYA